jgi:hypothetical protein
MDDMDDEELSSEEQARRDAEAAEQKKMADFNHRVSSKTATPLDMREMDNKGSGGHLLTHSKESTGEDARVAYSPDGLWLASSGSTDLKLHSTLLNATNNEQLVFKADPGSKVTAICFTQSASDQGRVKSPNELDAEAHMAWGTDKGKGYLLPLSNVSRRFNLWCVCVAH